MHDGLYCRIHPLAEMMLTFAKFNQCLSFSRRDQPRQFHFLTKSVVWSCETTVKHSVEYRFLSNKW